MFKILIRKIRSLFRILKVTSERMPLKPGFKSKFFYLIDTVLRYLQSNIAKFPLNLWYKPPWVQVEVTTKCNLACPRCFRSTLVEKERDKDMSLETFSKIVQGIDSIDEIVFLGTGEAFMNPKFLEMLRLARARGVIISIATNGMLLNEEIIKDLIDLKVYIVNFSIDGVKKETFERIRVGSDFERVISNIKKLDDAKKKLGSRYPRLDACYTIYRDNINELPDVINLAHRLGIATVNLETAISFNKLGRQYEIYSLNPDHVQKIYDETKKRAKVLGIHIPSFPLPLEACRVRLVCSSPWRYILVRCDGMVFPCTYYHHYTVNYHWVKDGRLVIEKTNALGECMGDVNKESARKIWNNQKYRTLRDELRTGREKAPHKGCIFLTGIQSTGNKGIPV